MPIKTRFSFKSIYDIANINIYNLLLDCERIVLMNKEEVETIIKELTKEAISFGSSPVASVYGSVDINELKTFLENHPRVQSYDEIIKENNKLQERIEKAIEYIKNNKKYFDNIDDYWTTNSKLLEILGGKE